MFKNIIVKGQFSNLYIHFKKIMTLFVLLYFYAPASIDQEHNYSFWPVPLSVHPFVGCLSAKVLTLAISFDW